MKPFINYICIGLLAGLLSCQKNESAPATTEDVAIVVTSPMEGELYKLGDTINIAGNISYNGQLHGYITRISDSKGTLLFENEGHTHGDNITVNEQWVNNLNYSTDLTLELITVIDHNENKKMVKVNFKSQP